MKNIIFKMFLVSMVLFISVNSLSAKIWGTVGEYAYFFDESKPIATFRGMADGYDMPDSISIPEEVVYNNKKYTVNAVGGSAFWGIKNVRIINFPNSITSILEDCIVYASALEKIYFGENVNLIEESNFYQCNNIKEVHIANLKNWCSAKVSSIPFKKETELYVDNKKISDLYIPMGVTSVSDRVFCGCRSLKNVCFPSSVTSIGILSFGSCENLEKIELPDNITNVSQQAFDGCKNAKTLKISPNMRIIDNGVFSGCESLEKIDVPWGITEIHYDAFGGCTSLKTLVFPKALRKIESFILILSNSITDIYNYSDYPSLISVDARAWNSCSNISNVTLHVPASAMDRYKASADWKFFRDIVPIESTDDISEITLKSSSKTEIYDLNGVRIDKLRKGVNLVKSANGVVKILR